ncbi:AB hydrolase superfamily protein [Ceratobasidium theobromae]|uniref:AB hydrolase superfamily protein n=1 Tax=Ceratobasidium theobromae TaxID=1582974 RepID=A0A5N5QC19_9AGAM|nr:AB hydrolase superfamily protein [Ceratobasidium theobromae]
MADSPHFSNDAAVIPKQYFNHLDPEYRAFILSQPEASWTPLHKIGWNPDIRNTPKTSIPGMAEPVAVGSTNRFDLGRFSILALTPEGQAPPNGWPAFIYAHGGGWSAGDDRTEDSLIARACVDVRCVVISIHYRLAPENPFPAALDDTWDTLLWVRKEGQSKLNVNKERIAVGGYSAGGNLMAAVSQRAALSHPPIQILAQVLQMPCLDTTPTEDPESWSYSMRDYAEMPGLWAKVVLFCRDLYVPNPLDQIRPDASPLLQTQDEAFKNLAPAWISVSELDALRADGEKYAEKLQEKGVPVELKTYLGAAHLTLRADGVCELAQKMIKDQNEYLKTVFGA